jgi:hypothetical protein
VRERTLFLLDRLGSLYELIELAALTFSGALDMDDLSRVDSARQDGTGPRGEGCHALSTAALPLRGHSQDTPTPQIGC